MDTTCMEQQCGPWTVRRSGNRLLDSLAEADVELLQAQLIPAVLTMGTILNLNRSEGPDAIFPCDSTILSLQIASADGRAVEAVPIGAEGLLRRDSNEHGLAGFRCVVQVGGPALRVDTTRLAAAAAIAPTLKARLDGFQAALLGQALQSVACAALHPVEARTCRRLLSLHDRIGRAELPLTQEGLADSLGVRRTTITRIIAGLEERGLVQHRRSRILVTDRPGLEAASCECHAAVTSLFGKVSPGLYPARVGG